LSLAMTLEASNGSFGPEHRACEAGANPGLPADAAGSPRWYI
jgi:hypothetical protein